MPDTGNPNVFTTYKGKYQITPGNGQVWDTTNVMLTASNSVCLMGNVKVTQNVTSPIKIGTLPKQCCPKKNVHIQVLYEYKMVENDYQIDVQDWLTLRIQPTGEMIMQKQKTDGILYLNGLMFNIGDNWYM